MASVERLLPETGPPAEVSGPRLALVLGAGGVRGLAHVGALKVLETLDLPIDLVVGASMGALVGAAYAAGLRPGEIEAFVLAVQARQVVRLSPREAGLIGATGLETLLREVFGEGRFEDLPLAFATVATSLRHGRLVVLREGPLVPTLLAAVAMPLVFPPVRLGDDLLLDGGLVDGLPVSVARALGAQRVLAVDADVHAPHPLRSRPVAPLVRALRDRLLRRSDRLSRRLVLGRMLEAALGERPPAEEPDLLIQPRFGRITANHFHLRRRCITLGEEAARRALPALIALASSPDQGLSGDSAAFG